MQSKERVASKLMPSQAKEAKQAKQITTNNIANQIKASAAIPSKARRAPPSSKGIFRDE